MDKKIFILGIKDDEKGEKAGDVKEDTGWGYASPTSLSEKVDEVKEAVIDGNAKLAVTKLDAIVLRLTKKPIKETQPGALDSRNDNETYLSKLDDVLRKN